MKLTFAEFAQLTHPVPVVIHSLEQALYQVTVTVEGHSRLLVEDSGRPFRRHNLQRVREELSTLPIESITLRQQSAYDEMIGQPVRQQDNSLEVSLSLESYPPPVIH